MWSAAAIAAVFVLIGGAYAFGRFGGSGASITASLFGGARENNPPAGGETFPLWNTKGANNTNGNIDHPTACEYESGKTAKGDTVLISEIAWMGTEEGAQYEWIEIANIGKMAASMEGRSLVDKDEQIQFTFPKGAAILANQFLLLARNADSVRKVRADFQYAGNLKNENEGLRLFDEKCEVMDEVLTLPPPAGGWPAGNNAARRTMERNLATRGWYTSSKVGGTPKAENSAPPVVPAPPLTATTMTSSAATDTPTSTASEAPTPLPSAQGTIVISEVMAGKDGAANWDFVKLYNTGSRTADLTGWSVRKRSSSGAESALVAASRLEGKTISAGGSLLLAHPDYAGSPPADVVWPKSYTLAYVNNAVMLYDPDGAKASEISWAEIPKGQSYEP